MIGVLVNAPHFVCQFFVLTRPQALALCGLCAENVAGFTNVKNRVLIDGRMEG